MTTITLYKNNNAYKGFCVSGHSGYGEAGEDIVCSAISSAVMLTINAITVVEGCKGKTLVKEQPPKVEFILDSEFMENIVAQKMLQAFEVHLQTLAGQHKKFIKISNKEET